MVAITITASPLGLVLAFLGGVVSILSPCVLPLLPGLIGIVSGMSIDELKDEKGLGRRVLHICTLFSVGFSFVYIVIGLATTQLSHKFLTHSDTATRVGGALLLIFAGMLLANHLTQGRYFQMEKRPFLQKSVRNSSAVVIGAAFAFGWSPCIGPILGGVLAYASTVHALASRVAIILAYCLGLCVTMSGIVYASFRYTRFTNFINRHLSVFVWFSIIVMTFFGFILFFDKMSWLTAEITRLMDALGLSRLVTIG